LSWPEKQTWRRGGRRLEDGYRIVCSGGDLSAPTAAPSDGGHGGAEVDDLAEERGAATVAVVVPARGGEVGYDEEGAGSVGDPGEAHEVRKEGDGARVAGGRRRDLMRRAEGERQRWKRVSLPHRRAGCCMRRCGGDGGGSWRCVDPPHRLPMPRPISAKPATTVCGCARTWATLLRGPRPGLSGLI
jgi:hypothetical protein